MISTGLDILLSLPPLRDVIRETGLSARKSLGQNFILDLNVTRRIAREAGPLEGRTVLEIGPGPGGLTRALLIEGAAKVVAIERDERFAPALSQVQQHSGGRLELVFSDALKTDYAMWPVEMKIDRVVANLPYNIATPLIVGWLTAPRWPPWFDKLVVLVQKEVAERMIAGPGSEIYGRLSVLAQLRSRSRIVLNLPPSVFTPSPKVFSALLEITPVPGLRDKFDIGQVEKVTAAAFGQRRKMLRSSLSSLRAHTLDLLKAAELDPAARAEQLSVDDFARLAELLRHFAK